MLHERNAGGAIGDAAAYNRFQMTVDALEFGQLIFMAKECNDCGQRKRFVHQKAELFTKGTTEDDSYRILD